jgi:hypothetical protein
MRSIQQKKALVDAFAAKQNAGKNPAAPSNQTLDQLRARLDSIDAMLADPEVTMQTEVRHNVAMEAWDLRLMLNEAARA